jgi:hypothetical protein
MKERLNPVQDNGQEVATQLLRTLSKYSREDDAICEGRISVTIAGITPVACSFATYPNGDYVAWFNHRAKWHLWALVNENLRHVMEVTADQLETLLAECRRLDSEIRGGLVKNDSESED